MRWLMLWLVMTMHGISMKNAWNISDSKKNSARHDHKKWSRIFTWSTRYSCPILIQREFSRHIFEKYLSMKFHENLSVRGRILPIGWTIRHDDSHSRFLQFCEQDMPEGMPWIRCLFVLDVVTNCLNPGILIDIGPTKRHPDFFFVFYNWL